MKKILSTLLIAVMLFGNICYAQNSGPDTDRNAYYAGVGTAQYDLSGLNNPQELRGRGHDRDRGHGRDRGHDRDRRHDRGHRHQREHEHHDNDHHVDAGDIITGIVIYEVVKEILD